MNIVMDMNDAVNNPDILSKADRIVIVPPKSEPMIYVFQEGDADNHRNRRIRKAEERRRLKHEAKQRLNNKKKQL